MTRLSGREYLAIFKDEGLERTAEIRSYEQEIKVLEELANHYKSEGNQEKYETCITEAEAHKWFAIGEAEKNKRAKIEN